MTEQVSQPLPLVQFRSAPHNLQRQDSLVTLMLYVNFTLAVTFMPGVAEQFAPASLRPWLAATCIAGPFGMYAGILVLRMPMHPPWRCTPTYDLVLATTGATLAFGEVPDLVSIIGRDPHLPGVCFGGSQSHCVNCPVDERLPNMSVRRP